MSPHQARAAYQPIDCHSDDKTAYQSYNDRYPPPASIQDDDGVSSSWYIWSKMIGLGSDGYIVLTADRG